MDAYGGEGEKPLFFDPNYLTAMNDGADKSKAYYYSCSSGEYLQVGRAGAIGHNAPCITFIRAFK